MKQLNSTTQKMLNGVTPIYSNDDYSLSIFEANGSIMNMLVNFTESLTTELFPQNGTWSLVYWEDKLGIVHKEKKTNAERIQRVLYELNKYFTVTRKRLENVVNTYVENRNAKVIDVPGAYEFIVRIPHTGGLIGNGLVDAIEEIKPAHLQSLFMYVFEVPGIKVSARDHVYPVVYPKTNQAITTDNGVGVSSESKIDMPAKTHGYKVIYPITGMAFSY